MSELFFIWEILDFNLKPVKDTIINNIINLKVDKIVKIQMMFF